MPFVPDLSDRLVQVGFPAALAEELQTAIQGPVSGAGNAAAFADSFVDYIASGLALPTTGPLANNVTAGVAYVTGARTTFTGQAVTLAASSDNYIDAKADGTLQVSSVANGAGAPAVAVNGLRLGYVVTGASTATSAVVTGRDSLGNWLGNRTAAPACILGNVNAMALTGGNVDNFITFTAAALEQLDNASMHSTTTNSSRLTFQRAGLYRVSAWAIWSSASTPGATTLTVRKNGGSAISGMPTDALTANGVKYSCAVTADIPFNAGDYIESRIQVGNGISLTNASFSAVRVG